MDREQIEKKVIEVVGEYACIDREIMLGDEVEGDLDLDSLDRVEAIMVLEEEFSIDISDEDAEKWSTVGDVVNHIEEAV